MYLDPSKKCGSGAELGVIPTQSLEASLGLIIADGLSRVALGANYSITPGGQGGGEYHTIIFNSSNNYIWNYGREELSAMPQWTNITFSYKRYGYGYGFGTSTTATAISVLCLHALAALGAIATLLLWGRAASSGWDDFGSMFVLAFKSNPPALGELDNTGVGIRKIKTWKKKAMVRADGPGGNVQLVLKDETLGCTKLRVGEKYG
ncbi:hypothetical protein B0T25DRAFT_540125 [Lasiosphaeria hispida]|uniref:Uncharacterized protein n=1 Tax=Lasiosphaeria hispida TaxID=260671 RepID=A0AAJ0HNB8_9PEZI|nr:hypothetical protein B0T25DRAFT_540125 [Lasiosphaeria hispida]